MMQTKTLGIVLVVVGLVMMLYTGFNYVTTKKVVDLYCSGMGRHCNVV